MPETRTPRIRIVEDEYSSLRNAVPAPSGPALFAPNEFMETPINADWNDIPVYADPAPPIRSRPSRPDENFVPTPPAYNFESDPRNTYDH